jgi:hypothetical protein
MTAALPEHGRSQMRLLASAVLPTPRRACQARAAQSSLAAVRGRGAGRQAGDVLGLKRQGRRWYRVSVRSFPL